MNVDFSSRPHEHHVILEYVKTSTNFGYSKNESRRTSSYMQVLLFCYSSLLCRSRIPWIPMSSAIKSIERTSLRYIRSGYPPWHNANAISGYPIIFTISHPVSNKTIEIVRYSFPLVFLFIVSCTTRL